MCQKQNILYRCLLSNTGFPDGSAGKETTCYARDLGSIPGLGTSLGEGKGYPLQYSGLENSMDYRVQVRCCKEQYCIGTWNVMSMNQGKLEVVKQEMARVNVNILGISELKWIGMGQFNSDDHYIYYCREESLR